MMTMALVSTQMMMGSDVNAADDDGSGVNADDEDGSGVDTG